MTLEAQARASPLGLAVYMGSRPGARPYQAARHLVALNAAILEAVYGPRRRLIVACPPQHGKSKLVSVYAPAWYLGNNPDGHVLLGSYAAKLAKSLGRSARGVLEATGRDTFEVAIDADAQAAGEWRIRGHEGGMVSAGVAGDFRGRPGDFVIVDDPIKDSKQALSPGYLDFLWDWFNSVMEGRLSPTATVIVCSTRFHQRDLSGRLIEEFGDEWDVLRLPAIAESNDPLGREPGQALWPERYDEAYLEKRKRRVGSYWWAAEYQQRPSPKEGLVINPEWFRFWRSGRLPVFDSVILSVDANLKETEAGSYASLQVWGRAGADRYLLDRARGRYPFPELLRQFGILARAWPKCGRKLIEPTAAGPAAISMLRQKFTGVIPAPAPKGSKVARLRAVAPIFESRNVYVPHPEECPWVKEYIGALRDFPNGDGSDDGDATSQALAHWEMGGGVSAGSTAGDRERTIRERRGRLSERPRRPNMGRVDLWGANERFVERGRLGR